MFRGVSLFEVGEVKLWVPDDGVASPVKPGRCVVVKLQVPKSGDGIKQKESVITRYDFIPLESKDKSS